MLLFAGVKEAGWDPGDPSGTGVHLVMNNSILDATPNNLQHFMLMVVHQVQQQEDAWPFLHAVTAEEVPDYHDIIKVGPWLSVPDSTYARRCKMFISDQVTKLSLYCCLDCPSCHCLDSHMAGFVAKPSRPPVLVHPIECQVNTRLCKRCLLMIAGLVTV